MSPALLQPSGSIQTAPRPQFRPVLDEDSNNIPFGDFHDTIMQESEAFFQHRREESIVDYSEILSREIELLRLRHLDDEFEGADDETVPQFLQELRDSSEEDQPRACHEMLMSPRYFPRARGRHGIGHVLWCSNKP